MSEQLETWIDAAIGETREVLVREGKPIALRVVRASDEGQRALWGEQYAGRVTSVDRRLRGVFVNLGLKGAQGFLPLNADGSAGRDHAMLTEGASVVVSVAREAARSKSAVLQLVAQRDDGPPRRLAQHECDTELALAKPADAATRERIDELIEESLARTAPIPGGGVLTIEPTAALVAIDVDAGGRVGSNDPENFARSLNVAAALEAARQIRLRNLGGVIAIDFVAMRSNIARNFLDGVVRSGFLHDPWSVQFGHLSRFGVFELGRAQVRTPLHEQVCDTDGRLSTETVALMALRAIEREGYGATSRQIACAVAPEVMAWLETAPFEWRSALSARLGPRWKIEASDTISREKIETRAL